jgi:uncharacterized protein RhaS with RHS repeats
MSAGGGLRLLVPPLTKEDGGGFFDRGNEEKRTVRYEAISCGWIPVTNRGDDREKAVSSPPRRGTRKTWFRTTNQSPNPLYGSYHPDHAGRRYTTEKRNFLCLGTCEENEKEGITEEPLLY